MTELLILATLLQGEFTLYKIKQKIKNSFSVFSSASFGSVHPAVNKLEKNGYISAKRKMSSGGQKSSTYFITSKGKKYFEELMTAEITEAPLFSSQLINIKIMLLDFLDKNLRETAIESVKSYYEVQLLDTKELLENFENSENKDKNPIQIKFLKHHLDKISRELSWIQGLN